MSPIPPLHPCKRSPPLPHSTFTLPPTPWGTTCQSPPDQLRQSSTWTRAVTSKIPHHCLWPHLHGMSTDSSHRPKPHQSPPSHQPAHRSGTYLRSQDPPPPRQGGEHQDAP